MNTEEKKQVAELCQIAGREDLLPGFIKNQTSYEDAKNILLERKRIQTHGQGREFMLATRSKEIQNSPLVLATKKQGEKMRKQRNLLN